jgi:hypothetical protein
MQKREYPKTVFRKKMLKGVFWTGFALALFLSVVAIVRVGNASISQAKTEPMQQEQKNINYAASVGAQSFAENFAVQYFNWQNTDQGKTDRVKRLQPYLAKGLDEQAGLSFDGMEWDSSFSKSQVWNVKETGKDTALITLRIQHTLKKSTPPDPAAVEAAKNQNKPLPEATEQTKGSFVKYFVVPVKTDGQSFVVDQIPYFTVAPKKPSITADTGFIEDGKITDSKLQDDITSALNTFFKVYTTGTQEELSYYVKGDEIPSMNGIITFKEVKSLVIKPGKSKNEYNVHAVVVFQENQSNGQVIYPYELQLVKEQNRWFVEEMKNQ